jgi:tetratricopeptide (TPR) repeat protein
LGVPAPGADTSHARASDAVRLFEDRARLNDRSFQLADVELHGVVDLTSLLEGLPLAIELAAAAAVDLGVQSVTTQLAAGDGIRGPARRGVAERQRSMDNAIAWSYGLLDAQQQVLLTRLSLFAGGFSVDAGMAVCGTDMIPPDSVQGLISRLVDKSLVVPPGPAGPPRYRLLEPIRHFAAAELKTVSGGHQLASLSVRHADWCRRLTQLSCEAVPSEEPAWHDLLEIEEPNVLAALDHLHLAAPAQELELATRMGAFWQARGRYATGESKLARALAATAPSSSTWVDAAVHLASLRTRMGDHEPARRVLRDAIEIAAAAGDEPRQAAIIGALGEIDESEGAYPEARARYVLALSGAEAAQDTRLEGRWLGHLGSVAWYQGDIDEAARCFDGALAVSRAVGDRREVAIQLGHVGNVAFRRADFVTAQNTYLEALALAEELGDRSSEALWHNNLAAVFGSQGVHSQAAEHYRLGLNIAREVRDRNRECVCLANLGALLNEQGEYAEAVVTLERCLAVARSHGMRAHVGAALAGVGHARLALGDHVTARSDLTSAVEIASMHQSRWDEGTRIGLLAAVDLAEAELDACRSHIREAVLISLELGNLCAWPGLAAVDVVVAWLGATEEYEHALTLLGWAEETRRGVGLPRGVSEAERAAGVIDRCRQRVPPDEVERLWADGRHLSPEEAASRILRELGPAAAGSGEEDTPT